MDCKSAIAQCAPENSIRRSVTIAGRFVLLSFALVSIVSTSTARAADPSALANASLHGLEGHRIKLAAPHGGATVLVFYSTECPISNSYSPTFKSLVESFPGDKVKWIGVCVDPDLSDQEVKAHSRDFSLKFPVARDRQGSLARKLGAKMTPEAFVIDSDGRVRYHGRIDDQFAARQKRNVNPTENDLKDALARSPERQGTQDRFCRGRRLPYSRGGLRCKAHVLQGCGDDHPEELPGLSSPRPGGSVCPGDL